MNQEFSIDNFREQTAWDWRIAFYLFLSGASGGLIFVEIVLRIFDVIGNSTAILGAWIGLGLATLSLFVLFTHLGAGRARWRAFYVFLNIRHSWISRGATIVTILMGLRFMFILPEIWHDLPWGEGTLAGSFLRGAIMLFALAFMAYSGLVLSWWKSIPFWNTFLLPVVCIGYSFLCGAAALPIIIIIVEGIDGLESTGSVLWPLLLVLIIINGLALFAYIKSKSSDDIAAQESIRRLTQGNSKRPWWIGVILIGLIVPLIIVSLASLNLIGSSDFASYVLITACGCIILGGYLLRYCVLRVGIYAKFI